MEGLKGGQLALLMVVLTAGVAAADRPVPSTDKTIVHLFEWSWADVALECERFLGPMGYSAVQVSPPQEDTPGNDWWTRYQPVSYKLVSRSGGPDAFVDMVQRCKNVSVEIIVDAVINHMANSNPPPGQTYHGRAGSPIKDKVDFPGLYSCPDFHHYCPGGCQCPTTGNCEQQGCSSGGIDNVHNCNLGDLPDLATESQWVQSRIAGYFRNLSAVGVAGLRIDAAKHIPAQDMAAMLAQSNLYVNMEVILGGYGDSCVPIPPLTSLGSIWEFKYPSVMRDALLGNNLGLLYNIDSNSGYPDGSHLWAPGNRAISFVTNHDTFKNRPYGNDQWTLWLRDGDLYKAANVLLLALPYGQPTVFSSINTYGPWHTSQDLAPVNFSANCGPQGNNCPLQSPHSPNGCGALSSTSPYVCEHRWPAIASMVAWRKVAGLSAFTNGGYQMLNNGQEVSITRGSGNSGNAFLFLHIGGWRFDQVVSTNGMPPGKYCNVVVDGCWPCTAKCGWIQEVDGSGNTRIQLNRNEAVAFHIRATVPSTAETSTAVE